MKPAAPFTADYVVVGAGSAGCVLANRLSADPGMRVLLLEAGGSDRHLAVAAPAAFSKLFNTPRDWGYETEPEPGCNQRRLYVPRAKMLGGCSSMNATIYIRGRPSDYRRWEEMGATGWGWDPVLPVFREMEDNARGADEYHGVGGEVRVEDLRHVSPYTERFLEACYTLGIPPNPDFNGASQEGAGLFQVTQRRGRRWSAADAFLRPVMGRPNLTVQTGALVHRVVVERGRAVGVVFSLGSRLVTARAEAEVVLAAGTIGSPQILQLSGVGRPEVLQPLGITPLVESPVGDNLMDHPFSGVIYPVEPPTLDDAERVAELLRFLLLRRGMLTSNVAEAGAFVRSGPEVEEPDLEFHFGPVYFGDHGREPFSGNAISFGPALLTPVARGWVRLRSAHPADPPVIVGNHLQERADVDRLLAGIALAREIAAADPLREVVGREVLPGEGVTDREALERVLRERVDLLYHPVGTCRMGPPSEGVVDARLRVHGVEGLRVADGSVMPQVTAGNTNAPILMIAERAARFITGEEPAARSAPPILSG